MNRGLPTREAHGQARVALVLGHVLERLLDNAHQNRDIEHGERHGTGNDRVLPTEVHGKHEEAEHANDDGR